MKNKLFYLIGVASLLSYTGTFTSCVNGVDDEYLEQQFTDNGETDKEEGEELPDFNGDYSIEGDYDLVMTCNGEVLDGKKVIMTVDEGNETASITFAAAQTDLETAIATAIPGGVGGLVSGWGLKYTGSSPIPGEKEVTVTDVPLFTNGADCNFKGSQVQPTYTMNFKGQIEGEKMTIDIQYELTNQKLAGTWKVAPVYTKVINDDTRILSPFWVDWDSNVIVDLGSITIAPFGRPSDLDIKGKMNGLVSLIAGSMSPFVMEQIIGTQIGVENIVTNMLNSVTAKPNGDMYAIYSYSGDLQHPQWSGADGMPHNVIRYFYDPEKPDERIYLELNSGFIINLIESLASPTALAANNTTRADLRDVAKELIKLLVPIFEYGIPCEYTLEGNNLTLNIDGVVLKNILVKLMDVLNDPTVQEFINGAVGSLGSFQDMLTTLLEGLPKTLKYHDHDATTDTYSGECSYVKIGLKFVKG